MVSKIINNLILYNDIQYCKGLVRLVYFWLYLANEEGVFGLISHLINTHQSNFKISNKVAFFDKIVGIYLILINVYSLL